MAGDLQEVVPLLGYMDEPYARAFLMEQCVPPMKPEQAASLFRKARAAAMNAAPARSDPRILEFGPESDEMLARVRQDESFTRLTGGKRWSLCQLEIDKLIPFQKYLNATYAHTLSRDLHLESLSERIRFCLTRELLPRKSDMLEVQKAHLYAIEAEGSDLRVTGSSKNLDGGTGVSTISFTVGWGQPFVQVAKIGGRYILKNGHHRAFALRSRGIEYVPCVLLEANGYAELERTGPLYFGEASMIGERAPRFSSFFNGEISPRVRIRSVSTIIVIKPDVRVLEAQQAATSSTRGERLPSGPPAGELEYLDVRTIREDWNVYSLSDGTLLKLKASVARARRPRPGGEIEAEVSQMLSVSNPLKTRRGLPSEKAPSREELEAAIVSREIGFKTVREPINEYAAEGGHRILLQLRLLSVSSTSKYDENGDPLYVLRTRPDLMGA